MSKHALKTCHFGPSPLRRLVFGLGFLQLLGVGGSRRGDNTALLLPVGVVVRRTERKPFTWKDTIRQKHNTSIHVKSESSIHFFFCRSHKHKGCVRFDKIN